ncbi:Gfo/Idh/MocA family protein [Fodinibius salsisoli]|uniref:Gfo/Idh/MocA family oxidoreductase n=1 Tax=Fodinibius salsisoli TaxID=2820877 RepID=A0ABT3PK73_9BACT|nr:Gfo/Idh/MocA family oxidoreductase [Fodinibius salsisoli]MCW9706342.1 Gfo/Idh/MocA family oxidoreductase [Fodinibius salsisoli]
MKYFLSAFLLLFFNINSQGQPPSTESVEVVVAGLSHDHVHWILGREESDAISIVGIYEPDKELQQRYARQYDLDETLFYTDLEEALDTLKPQAVTAFGPVYDHLSVVEASALRGIHVMVEKPLAVSWDHARKMKALADQHDIHLLTNYETSWYSSNHRAYEMVHEEQRFGDLRKMVVHDGHQGPKEIGVSDEFLEWLPDPKLNGGGALMDFGCYGANLITWLMKGEEPVTVQAVTQQIKPETYPKVEDEATIILTYPKAQGIIQASWNWPYSRKDMQVYGQTGYVFADNDRDIRYMEKGKRSKKKLESRPGTL